MFDGTAAALGFVGVANSSTKTVAAPGCVYESGNRKRTEHPAEGEGRAFDYVS